MLPGLGPGPPQAQTVDFDWPLIPTEIQPGQSFRLLFVTSTTTTATSDQIGTSNRFVQGRATAGHTAIRNFSGQFRALLAIAGMNGVDARDYTATTTSGTDTGVPIYRLGGSRVANDYVDFYDGNRDFAGLAYHRDVLVGLAEARLRWRPHLLWKKSSANRQSEIEETRNVYTISI